MYPATESKIELFKHGLKNIEITINGQLQSISISNENLIENSLSVNRYATSGERVEIGSVIAAELTLQLHNYDAEYSDVVFEGAEMYVRVSAEDENGDIQYIPIGYFTVDEAPRATSTISLVALDRMMNFERPADIDLLDALLHGGANVKEYVEHCCSVCGVALHTDLTTLPNYDYVVSSIPEDEGLTYRQLLSYCAEIMGTCSYIDWNGELRLEWYHDTGKTIALSDKLIGTSDVDDNVISLTGIQCTATEIGTDGISEEVIYRAGSEGYVLNIEGNSLLQHDYDTVLMAIWNTIYSNGTGHYSYHPASASVLNMPWLYPLDIVNMEYIKRELDPETGEAVSVTHTTKIFITDVTWKPNGATLIQSKGETATNDGYASTNPLTAREKAIIAQITRKFTDNSDAITNTLHFNELITNALGMNMSVVDGKYYIHNDAALETSNTVFTITDSGIAWTDNYQGSETVWQYGVDAAGRGFFQWLVSEGITLAKATDDYSTIITPHEFVIKYRQMEVLRIEGSHATVKQLAFAMNNDEKWAIRKGRNNNLNIVWIGGAIN